MVKKSLLFMFVVVIVLAQVLTGCGKKGQLSGRIYESGTEEPILKKVFVTLGGQTITVNNGEFLFKDLSAGTQTLKAQADGYKVYTASVKINEGQTTKHNVRLEKEDRVFAYVASASDPSYGIYGYTVNAASGGFTPIIGSPFSTIEMKYPTSLVADADGKMLYVANYMDNSVSAFGINPIVGSLDPIAGSPFTTDNNPRKVVMSPVGEFVAVGCSYALNIFSRGQTSGILSDRQVFTFAQGEELKEVIFDMTGDYVYVAVSTGYIYVYSKNPDGTFTQIAGSPFATRPGPSDLAFGPEGNYLYVATSATTAMGYHSVNSDGSLGAVTNINLAGQTSVCAVIGNTFYTNLAFKNLKSYTINANGTLSEIGSTITLADDISSLAIEPSGKHLYATTGYTDDIWVLAINPDGTLSQPTGDPFETGYEVSTIIIVNPE